MMILRILLGVVLMTLAAMPATAELVGYWRFEGDLTSEIGGSALNATIGEGTPDSGTAGGQVGNCIYFNDADNEYIVLPVGFGTDSGTGASLGNTFSISAWYNLQPIEGNASARFFVYEGSSDYDLSYGVRDWDGDGDVDDGQAYIHDATPATTLEFIDAATQNTWHHVLATYESDGGNTTVTYWIDGVKQTPSMVDASSNIGSPAIHVGDYRSTSDRDWDGLIDEVAVWDHKLTDQEVLFVHSQGLNGQPIPEPSTLTLFGLAGLFGLGMVFKRRRA